MERLWFAPESLRVEVLTEATMHERLQEVMSLNDSAQLEFGASYSPARWTAENLTRALPAKWQLSRVAFDQGNNLVAFLIASSDEREDLVMHLMAMQPRWRHLAVFLLRELLGQVFAEGRRLGLKYGSGTVGAANSNAVYLWETLGLRKLEAQQLEAFRLRRRRMDERIEGDQLVSPDGYRRFAFQVELDRLGSSARKHQQPLVMDGNR